ncbi:MAG: ribose-phosphate pyrophosphokinase, partial [Eubacteriaceae bacterium]|nr:ribose-phosphate pyrophosphokinase [Eubacteriaceae bacterium]
MNGLYNNIKLMAGSANLPLAKEISSILDIPLCDTSTERFSDGETYVNINESVRGCDIFVIQSVSYPVNDNLMELLIYIDALKRASAARINAVIPYYGYARQDRKVLSRAPITARLVADLITAAGADRVITMDLHADQIQGFFNIPMDHLTAISVIVENIAELGLTDFVVVSPDVGSVKRTRKVAGMLDAPMAIIDKRRYATNATEVMQVIGDVKGKNLLLIDDMIDTAGTMTNSIKALKEMGAKKIYAAATHGVLSGKAIKNLDEAPVEKVFITNTIELPKEKQ